jgi:hypothetical protein
METTLITQRFVEALNKKFAGHQTLFGVIKFDVIAEEAYDKITLPKWNDSPHGSAHAFIEHATGKIFKAASWKYPVMDSKFDLGNEEEFAKAVGKSDPYGTYLETRNRDKSYVSPYGYGIENENPHKVGI